MFVVYNRCLARQRTAGGIIFVDIYIYTYIIYIYIYLFLFYNFGIL